MEISVKIQSDNAIKWLEALLSGEYLQGKGVLGNEEMGYCCWGVGCKILDLQFDEIEEWNDTLYLNIGFLSGEKLGGIDPVVDYEGVTYDDLASLNDEACFSFEKIADYLIQNCKTNFIPGVAKAITKHFKNNGKLNTTSPTVG